MVKISTEPEPSDSIVGSTSSLHNTSYFQIQTSLLASESNVANLRTTYNMENLI